MNLVIMPPGWMRRKEPIREKTSLCGFLAVMWFVVSFLCAWVFETMFQGGDSKVSSWLFWFCIVAFTVQVVLIGLMVYFRLTEEPRIPRP